MLLPPPPLYRPFQQLAEKSSTDLKSKTPAKKPATTKPAATGEKKIVYFSLWRLYVYQTIFKLITRL